MDVVWCCPRELFPIDRLVVEAAVQSFHIHSATHRIGQEKDFLPSIQHARIGRVTWYCVCCVVCRVVCRGMRSIRSSTRISVR